MKTVYVDMDDVLTDSTEAFLAVLEQDFGKKVAFDEIFDFDLKKSFHLTDGEYERFFSAIHQPDIILDFKPIQDSIQVLKAWRKSGFRIVVVTGRLTATYESSQAWLAVHDVPYDDFIMLDKYSRKDTDMRIAVSLEEFSKMKFDLAVEDSLRMAQYLSTEMEFPVILFDRPWNRDAVLNGRIHRCRSWIEIGKIAETVLGI